MCFIKECKLPHILPCFHSSSFHFLSTRRFPTNYLMYIFTFFSYPFNLKSFPPTFCFLQVLMLVLLSSFTPNHSPSKLLLILLLINNFSSLSLTSFPDICFSSRLIFFSSCWAVLYYQVYIKCQMFHNWPIYLGKWE